MNKKIIFIRLAAVCAVLGMLLPLEAGKDTWTYITFAYIFLAAVLPMWLLMQPRDYMTTFMFAGMIIGAAVGLLVAHPAMNLPAFTGFHNEKLGDMFPILFVTVACGAVSGFHSLVSSGTSSKTIANEKDMLKVGYGAMVLESLLAVLALCVAGAAAAADGTAAAGTPFQIFSSGVAGFLEMFGIPVYVAQCFMTMCVSALALTSLEEQAHKTRIETQKALLLQQKKNEEDKIQRMKADEAKKQEEDAINKKRNAEKRDSILSLSSQIEKKAQAIRDKKTEALNAAQRIVIIEGEKLALLENENTIAASIEDYNSKLKAECEAQMKARRERKTPTAEKNPDGTLNERGLMSLENDILEIKAKYEDLEAKNESDIREKTNEAQEQLRKKIAADINKLESKKYTITSIAEQGLYLRIGNYDGNIGKEGWKYGLAFSFDGQTVYETEDLLSYKDLTGKTVPGYPKLGSKNREQNLKLYNQYLDTVENYDSFFRMNVPFVEAVLTYSVRTQSYKNPSSYMLVIEKIEFRNVSTGKKIKTVMPLKHCPYQYTPSVDIDWRTESVQKSDYEEMLKQNRLKKQAELDAQKKEEQKQKKEQKKEEQEQKKEQKKEEQEQKKEQKKKAKSASSKSSKQDPRDTICSLLYEFIPGAVNFYANDKSAYITVGYTATIGLSDNMFIGGNLEAGCGGTAFFSVPQSDDYYYDSSYYETDDTAELVLTCSGILGASYNIAKYLRASVYGEGGYILNELGGGVGASLELYIPKSFGIMVSSSVLYNDTNKFMLKYSAGIELCF